MEAIRPEIGKKIRELRLRLGLTQEELAARTELTKGFISQLENDVTSPSIATLMDILEALGTNISAFFTEQRCERVVYTAEDMFEKEDEDKKVLWLVTDAQRNALEPILVTLGSGAQSDRVDPHEGEEFGYVLSGTVTLIDGDRQYRVPRGASFYLRPQGVHYLENRGKQKAAVLWVSTPPSF